MNLKRFLFLQDIFSYLADFKVFLSKNRSYIQTNKFMSASYLPSILVPLVGLVFPAITMASLFLYIEQDEIL